MSEYFIQYPISTSCNLHCPYCFHAGDWENKWERGFSLDKYIEWRNKFIKPEDKILVQFHGGEPSMKVNMDDITQYIDNFPKDTIELLTNGLGTLYQYERLIPYLSHFKRIVVTYHRSVVRELADMQNFVRNVLWFKENGFNVVVKELLIHGNMGGILHDKATWDNLHITVVVADFRGMQKGRSFEEWKKYNKKEIEFIDDEFKHAGVSCECKKGLRNILIRGGWQGGDILACFENPVKIGSIQDLTWDNNWKLIKDSTGKINIQDVPQTYVGTYERDLWKPGIE